VWGHHKIKGLAKITLGLLFWGYIGATFYIRIKRLRGGGQKLAVVRLLRYCTHIFFEKGIL